MKSFLLSCVAVLLVLLGASTRLPARTSNDAAAVVGTDQRQLTDEALDIRIEMIAREKGGAAAFRFVEREFGRNPRPRSKAWFGEYLLYGKVWNAPEGRREEGLRLLRESLDAGDLHAMSTMGLEMFLGERVARDPIGALKLLNRANNAGYRIAINTLGDLMLGGACFGQVNPVVAEHWYRKGAFAGGAYPLFTLGRWYEAGVPDRASDLVKAVDLYREAAIHGSVDASKRLRELAAQPGATADTLRAHYLVELWSAALGAPRNRAEKTKAAKTLLLLWPKDPVVLVALGRLYRSGFVLTRDDERAFASFDQAAQLGSADGRCERARMLAEGLGVPRDVARALAELRALEALGHPGALAVLGYYHYWGQLKGAGLTKDPVLAFTYSKRAAEGGDLIGQRNVTTCFEFGIGTEINYPLTAHFCQIAASRGDLRSQQHLPRVISEILD